MDLLIDRLNLIKRERDLTIKRIAEEIGLSRDVVTNYFNGRSEIPASVIPALANALGVDITWLLTGVQGSLVAEPAIPYTPKSYLPADGAIRSTAESLISIIHNIELLNLKTDYLEREIRKLSKSN